MSKNAGDRSTLVVLENSPHPIFDGIDENRMMDIAHHQKQEDDNTNVSRNRKLYSSETEFISSNQPPPASLPDHIDSANVKEDDEKNNDDTAKMEYSDGEESVNVEEIQLQTLEHYVESPPDYTKANTIPFKLVCDRLEQLWLQLAGKGRRKVSKAEKLAYLLPKNLLQFLEGGSPFPYLRLILPASDSSRPHTGLKEAKIIQTYKQALNLPRDGRLAKSMEQWRDSNMTGKQAAGDISLVIENVLKERMPCSGSKLTVGEVNEWLDVVALLIKARFHTPTGEVTEKSKWRMDLEKLVTGGRPNEKKQDKHAKLIERLVNKNLSPVEHKWIVRILLQHIHIGLNLRDILGYWHPHAMEIYNSNNKLESVCTRLSDPVYLRLLNAMLKKSAEDAMEGNREQWMTRSNLPAKLEQTISPMLSLKTTFHSFLTEIADRHHKLDDILPDEAPSKSCLALRHPTFACEIKMDGERSLCHIKRGKVTFQTRSAVWYSNIYSPALAPHFRKALRYDVDVILDGEVLAWDTEENKPVPFGSNRTVAELHRNRNRKDGLNDDRDENFHMNEPGNNVMTIGQDKQFRDTKSIPISEDDRTLWMKYCIYDILFVSGPGKSELLSKSSHLLTKDELSTEGSIINLDCLTRKSIIYNLIQPQINTVEPVKSIIIRSDGSSMDAGDYYLSKCGSEYGRTPSELDSIRLALAKNSDTFKFDSQRLNGRTHEDIEKERSLELEKCFRQIVDVGGQEGLVMKDLAAPYYLGSKSRRLGYWWKLKPDYDAVWDVDVVVLGGRFGTGYQRSGMIDSILVGCIDDQGTWGMTREGPPQ